MLAVCQTAQITAYTLLLVAYSNSMMSYYPISSGVPSLCVRVRKAIEHPAVSPAVRFCKACCQELHHHIIRHGAAVVNFCACMMPCKPKDMHTC